jgi:hypothetical protein
MTTTLDSLLTDLGYSMHCQRIPDWIDICQSRMVSGMLSNNCLVFQRTQI